MAGNTRKIEKDKNEESSKRALLVMQDVRNALHRRLVGYVLNNAEGLRDESNSSENYNFLHQQMEWREELGDARAAKDSDALEALDDQLRKARKQQLAQIEQQIDAGDFQSAAQGVRALMFLEKFGEEVRFAFEAIEA